VPSVRRRRHLVDRRDRIDGLARNHGRRREHHEGVGRRKLGVRRQVLLLRRRAADGRFLGARILLDRHDGGDMRVRVDPVRDRTRDSDHGVLAQMQVQKNVRCIEFVGMKKIQRFAIFSDQQVSNSVRDRP
jgi:hypothetical protein